MIYEELPPVEPSSPPQPTISEQVLEQAKDIEAHHEETQAASYTKIHQKTSSGDLIAPQGNNASITIYNYYGRVVQRARENLEHNEDDEKTTLTGTESELLQNNLSFELEGASRLFSSRSSSQRSADQLPLDEEALTDWYYELNEYEQCFVQSVAICHGAPAHDLYQEADVLYRLVQRQKYASLLQAAKDGATEQGNLPLKDISIPRQPRLQLLKRTLTLAKRTKGAECLFWRDVDEYGLSHFGHRVLAFLARELICKGEHWPDLLQTIHDWSKAQIHTRQIARALGVIYWCQNIALLRQRAREWAKEPSFSSRRKVTSFLEGAFEIEQLQSTSEHNTTACNDMIVITLLRDWASTMSTELNKTNVNIGCAIASTYGSIGKREQYTPLALQGLRALLDIGIPNTGVNIQPLSTSVISNYVSLVWAGHGRLVLTELTESMQALIYHYQHPKRLAGRDSYQFSRELWLKVTIDAFFLIAAAIAPEQTSQTRDSYKHSLPHHLEIPDPEGRNIFVWAIISDDKLSQLLQTLLCAIITTPRRKAAFELMSTWIDLLLTLWERDMQEKRPYRRFVHFLADLGRQLLSWQQHLQQRGYKLSPVFNIYRHQLQIWEHQKQEKHLRKDQLIEDVLSSFKDTE